MTAALRLERAGQDGVRVSGAVHGELTQTCVVSLEPFAATVDEDIDVRFAPRSEEDSVRGPKRETETFSIADEDEPDPIIEGKIDVGALAAEFFALGLDPYPRKPGVEFVAAGRIAAGRFAVRGARRQTRQAIAVKEPARLRAPLSPAGRVREQAREAEIKSGRAAARRHFALRLDEDVEHFLACDAWRANLAA